MSKSLSDIIAEQRKKERRVFEEHDLANDYYEAKKIRIANGEQVDFNINEEGESEDE